MSEATPAPAIAARRCKLCELLIEDINPNTWPYVHGVRKGAFCKPCAAARKRDFEAKRRKERVAARAAGTATLDGVPAERIPGKHSGIRLPTELPTRHLAISKALRGAAEVLNDNAESIIRTIVGYVNDARSPHHEWAMRLLAERVLPKGLYDDLGRQEAGIGAGLAGGPRIMINILPSGPAQPTPNVNVVEVQALPDRSESNE